MENFKNMKVNAFKRFFENNLWTKEQLKKMQKAGYLTQEECTDITAPTQTLKNNDLRVGTHHLECVVWDKTSPINGIPAQETIASCGLERATDIILTKISNTVLEINDAETLKINYGMNLNITAEQVAEQYEIIKEEEKNAPRIVMEDVQTAMAIYSDFERMEKSNQIVALLTEIKNLLENRR